MQMRTRRERRFSETEASLPSNSQHSSFKLDGSTPPKVVVKSKVTNLLSYLGVYNPRPLPITEKNVVWLMDNVAYRGAQGNWEAEFVAAVFEQESPGGVIDTVQEIANRIGLAKDDKAIDTIQARIAPFTQDILPGRQVLVDSGRDDNLKLGPGGRNGISSDVLALPSSANGAVVTSGALVPNGVTGVLEMKTLFAEPEGWGIISGKSMPRARLYCVFLQRLTLSSQISTIP